MVLKCKIKIGAKILKLSKCKSQQYLWTYHASFISWFQVMYGLPFGVEVDMWSLGCIIAELYIGQPLFYGTDKKTILSKVGSGWCVDVVTMLAMFSDTLVGVFTDDKHSWASAAECVPKREILHQSSDTHQWWRPKRWSVVRFLDFQFPDFLIIHQCHFCFYRM